MAFGIRAWVPFSAALTATGPVRRLRRYQSVLDRRRRGLDSVHSHYDVGLEFAAKICSRIGVQRPPLIMLT
jgi:hypothetical protein